MKKTITYELNNETVHREVNYIPFRYILAVLIALWEVLAVITIVVLLCAYVPYFYLAAWATEIACIIRMVFMGVAVFICLFISDDFRSGYAKNLFTVRAKKGDYVVSKTIAGFVCGALMLVLYFIGAMLGGAISGLSFDLGTLTAGNIVMCMLAKIFLMLVFVSIFVLVSVAFTLELNTFGYLCCSIIAAFAAK